MHPTPTRKLPPISRKLRSILRVFIPLLLISFTIGVIISVDDIEEPRAKVENLSPVIPLLPTLDIASNIESISIRTQGIILPHHEINIISQVSGVITKTSPNFKSGDRFLKDDFLFQIDQRDYELALTKAQAEVASAEQKLIREQAESKLAKSDWLKYGKGDASALTLRLPQMQEARARLDAARADLNKTKLDLSRTLYKAPFDGVIKNVSAETGQYVSTNSSVIEIFSDQKFEIRLPISRKQLEYLPVSKNGNIVGVVSFTDPQRYSSNDWFGKILRLEKELLAGSNQYVLVAELENFNTAPNSPNSLLSGTFLNAEITSKKIVNLYEIPRSSLYLNDSVLVVDRLDFVSQVKVKIINKHNDIIYVTAPISYGTRIITKPPEVFVEGMKIRTNSNGATGMLLSIKELEQKETSTHGQYVVSSSSKKSIENNE